MTWRRVGHPVGGSCQLGKGRKGVKEVKEGEYVEGTKEEYKKESRRGEWVGEER